MMLRVLVGAVLPVMVLAAPPPINKLALFPDKSAWCEAMQGTVASEDFCTEPALVFEERLIRSALGFEGGDIWWLAFSLLGQGGQGV